VRRATLLVQVGVLARRSVVRTLRQPAMVVPSLVFPLMLLSINSSGLESATHLPGFPTDSYFQFALAIAFVQGALFSANSAGTNVANDIESGFLNRLALTPLRRLALMVGQLAGILALGLIQAVTFVLVGVAFGDGIAAGVDGALVIVALSLVISLAFGCIGAFVALRSGRGRAGGVPAVLRGVVPVVDVTAARPDRDGLVPNGGHLEPGLLHARGDQVAGDRGMGRRGDRARVRLRRRPGADRDAGGVRGAAYEAGAHMTGGFWTVARAVGWRNIHNFFTNPAILVPSLLFPMFFFTAFAGGLSRVDQIPGFDYQAGYTTFVYGFVLLQASTFGGIFTGFSVARDFESGFSRRLLLAARSHGGIIGGYWLAALTRAIFTVSVITTVAVVAGLDVNGDAIDLVGLYTLAVFVNAAAMLFGTGIAMRLRTMQAGPLMQVPAFLLLFLAPVWVPYDLLTGWVKAAASFNPITLVLEAGRGFLAGDPTKVLPAFAVALVLAAVTMLWARGGLRSAERAA
jgi:ABC-2 type transport system permease protein